MAIEKELLDQLLAGRDPNEVFAKDGLLDDLKKALSERILNAELDKHLDGERVEGGANRRNGHSKKSVLTGTSKMTLSIPRDRAGTFDPKLIAKYQRDSPTSTTVQSTCIDQAAGFVNLTTVLAHASGEWLPPSGPSAPSVKLLLRGAWVPHSPTPEDTRFFL